MIRLARRLLAQSNGTLTVFADPAQGIYECGFQWTQQELRPAGGNVHWLRKTYRTTRQIFDLVQPLVDNGDDVLQDLAQLEPPERYGPIPQFIIAHDETELHAELVLRIEAELETRPANQVGVLAANHKALDKLRNLLQHHNIPATLIQRERDVFQLSEATVKLLTMHSAKGLDFPCIFIIGPSKYDLGGVGHYARPENRRLLYVALTRSSECLTIGAIHTDHHPLLEELDDEYYEAEGSCAKSFVNLRGVQINALGRVILQS